MKKITNKAANISTRKIIKGFTLAEVLITLLIIGVVSSIVIPALIANTQDQEFRVAWKKGYADISQAVKKISLDNAGTFKGLCSTGIHQDKNMCLTNLFATYLNYNKKCDPNISQGNCWHNDNQWQYLNGTKITDFQDQGGLILNNGSLLIFNSYASNCDSSSNNIFVCAAGTIDINGFKKPNTVGKDIFSFYILSNTIIPFGTKGDWYDRYSICQEGDTSTNNYGSSCSAKYLMQ